MSAHAHCASAWVAALTVFMSTASASALAVNAGQPTIQAANDTALTTVAMDRGGRGGGGHAGGGHQAGAAGRGAGAHNAGARAGGANRPAIRSDAKTNINYSGGNARGNNVHAGNTNIHGGNKTINNNNVNVNRDVNVNRNNDFHGGDWDNDWDDHWHPAATIAAVAVTAAVVGSVVRSIPPSCTTVVVNGIGYSQCGSTWYAPQYSGSSVQYVVVSPPQ
jgi:hypothetical protein